MTVYDLIGSKLSNNWTAAVQKNEDFGTRGGKIFFLSSMFNERMYLFVEHSIFQSSVLLLNQVKQPIHSKFGTLITFCFLNWGKCMLIINE